MSCCTSTTLKKLTQQTHLKHDGFFFFKKSTVSYFVIINKVTLRLLWKGKRFKKANMMLKKNVNKVRGLTTLRLTIELWKSRQYGTGKNRAKRTKKSKTDKWIHGPEYQAQKHTHNWANWYLMKAKAIQWRKSSFSTNVFKLDIHMPKQEGKKKI